MTTKQFLIKNLGRQTPGVTSNKIWCSSVFIDTINGQTTAYSYGYHYPLATIIDGQAFINSAGYSMTTSKHIGWACSAAGELVGWENVHQVELISGRSLTPRDITDSLHKQIDHLNDTMATKKRTDTAVYRGLEYQRDRALRALTAIMSVGVAV